MNEFSVVGAEMFVLKGGRGVVGVDGSADEDGDIVGGRELSSATTTSAGVPLRS